MKKVIAIYTILATICWIVSPALVGAAPITTQLTPATGGGSADPIVIKAKWEMYTPGYLYGGSMPAQLGEDESISDGAQFAAPGIWGQNLQYRVCGVVHGPSGSIENIRDVYTEIFWPKGREMHTTGHAPDTGTDKGIYNVNGAEIDNPTGGCGVLKEQNKLIKLSQTDAINLVCNILQVENPGLVTFYSNYNFTELCNNIDGQLVKGRAAVFCDDKTLTWEDPAGDYKVDVFAYDLNNNRSNILTNNFTYLQEVGFGVDFGTVNYGSLAIGEHKKIYGNKYFLEAGSSALPTIRNLGNTRLTIGIAQDDMALGKLDADPNTWRVQYNARIGDIETNWTTYSPFGIKGTQPGTSYILLKEILDLSEIEEMDFSVKVTEKWPSNLTSYSGNMWLNATEAAWGVCGS
jgi:hypothetical protein